jgi:hypothetical protein
MRSVEEVLEDHLRRQLAYDLDGDVAANYAEDCIVVTSEGVFLGRAGAREAEELFHRRLPGARYTVLAKHYRGELALLEWMAERDGILLTEGLDTFLIRDGVIRVMTTSFGADEDE